MLITREIQTLDATRRSQKLYQLYIAVFYLSFQIPHTVHASTTRAISNC